MSEIELFLNRLGVKLITENIKLSELEEKEVETFFANKNKQVGLNIRDVEDFDKELSDVLILKYGGLGAMVKVECLIREVREAHERLRETNAGLNLWLLLVALKGFKSRLSRLCVVDIEQILLKAFSVYNNGKSDVVLEEFVSDFGEKDKDVEVNLGLDTDTEVSYEQMSFLDEEPKKEEEFKSSPLGKAISRRMTCSNDLYKLLRQSNLLLDFIDFGCNLTEELKSRGTLEAVSTASVVSAAIKDVADSAKYQVRKKEKSNISGQRTIMELIRK